MKNKFWIGISIAFISANLLGGYHSVVRHYWSDLFIEAQLVIFWTFVLVKNLHDWAHSKAHQMLDEHMPGLASGAEDLVNEIMEKFEIPGQAVIKAKKIK